MNLSFDVFLRVCCVPFLQKKKKENSELTGTFYIDILVVQFLFFSIVLKYFILFYMYTVLCV